VDRSTAGGSVIAADHLSKWYGQVIGLNDITLAVPPGITGLLGPNGAGKSTFMKLVTGQLKPSKGTITVLGEPIWNNPSLYARLGFCPEQDAFYERMTGLEWVTALVSLNGVGETAARDMSARAIETVGLSDAAGKKIGAYSKACANASSWRRLAHDPDVLILDEPPRAWIRWSGDDSPDQRLGPIGKKRSRVEPHPARDLIDDFEHLVYHLGPHSGRGQCPSDS
jgi:ABC-2 type transport system ATP-binding protein